MTGKDAAQTTLEKWLAEYPAPDPTAVTPAIPTDEIKKAAHFFGFKPEDLTWEYNESNLIVAVLGGIPVWFGKLSNENGGGFFAVVDDRGLMDTPLMLAECIRDKQAEDVKAEAYANRARVMLIEVLPFDVSASKALATISHLLNHEGWKIYNVHTEIENDHHVTVQIYTLIHD